MIATTTQTVKIELEFTVTIRKDVEGNRAEYSIDRQDVEAQIAKQFFAQIVPDFDSESGDRCGGASLVGIPNSFYQV